MRAGMFHQHVVVQVLAAIADEQTIDQALSSVSRQYGMHIISYQTAAQQRRMRRNIGAPLLLNAQRGDVERIGASGEDLDSPGTKAVGRDVEGIRRREAQGNERDVTM